MTVRTSHQPDDPVESGLGSLAIPKPSLILGLVVQRTIGLVGYGLQAAASASPADLSLPGLFFNLQLPGEQALTPERAPSEFRSWMLAHALTDCVEAVGGALESARVWCLIWSQPSAITKLEDGSVSLAAQIAGEFWNREVVGGSQKFDRLPLPEKFAHIQSFGVPELSHTNDILSLNAARNCLTHRGGVVGAKDLPSPTAAGLTVTWQGFRLEVKEPSGVRTLSEPGVVQAGAELSMTTHSVSRTFALGSPIVISAQDLVDIGTTFILFANELEVAIGAWQNELIAQRT